MLCTSFKVTPSTAVLELEGAATSEPVDDVYHFRYHYLWPRDPNGSLHTSTAPIADGSLFVSGYRASSQPIARSSAKTSRMLSSLGRSACRLCDHWEVRSNLTGSKIARVVFCVDESRMVLLHGFIKKSQKTPQKEIDLALKRKQGEER